MRIGLIGRGTAGQQQPHAVELAVGGGDMEHCKAVGRTRVERLIERLIACNTRLTVRGSVGRASRRGLEKLIEEGDFHHHLAMQPPH